MLKLVFSFIIKSLNGKKCVKFLKQHYPKSIINNVDQFIRLHCDKSKKSASIEFYNSCLATGRFLKWIKSKLRRLGLHASAKNCRRLLKSTLESCQKEILDKLSLVRTLATKIYADLSVCQLCKLFKFLKVTKTKCYNNQFNKHQNLETLPAPQSYFPVSPDKFIFNFSSHQLSKLEKECLSFGLKFCVPPKVNHIKLKAEFESFVDQLKALTPTSDSAFAQFKANLVNLNEWILSSKNQQHIFTKEHKNALNDLLKNDDIIISKPDKGSGVVILNKSDYITKVSSILSDTTKFSKDNGQIETYKLEVKINKILKKLLDNGHISNKVFEDIKTSDSSIPRLYGLPKIHKNGCPLRPILSMVGSASHNLAQWLCQLLDPVREALCKFTVKDTFQFVELIQHCDISTAHMCSFDVSALFTNVPLMETIDIIVKTIHDQEITLPIPIDEFKELLTICTYNVQFLFNSQD